MILKLKDLRKSKGMTLEELAAKSGVSRRMISAYEANESDITLTKMHQIANALECSITELIGIELLDIKNDPESVYVRITDQSEEFLKQRIEDLKVIIESKDQTISVLLDRMNDSGLQIVADDPVKSYRKKESATVKGFRSVYGSYIRGVVHKIISEHDISKLSYSKQ